MQNETVVEESNNRVAESYKDWSDQNRSRIEKVLEHWLVSVPVVPQRLADAVSYTTLGGGKRIRALLAYAAGELLGVKPQDVDASAAAVELIHTYSLVHDDLPAMDDDDLRRGKPTVHKAYDEATAILTGDALLTLAFYVLAKAPVSNSVNPLAKVQAVELLADAAGGAGMVGGQALDMAAEKKTLSKAELDQVFNLKTGCLIHAAVMLPSFYAEQVEPQAADCLDRFARLIGLAFQIHDDVLDVVASTETLGKAQGSDVKQGKSTYPSLLGLEQAKAKALDYYQQAIDALKPFGSKAETLACLARTIVFRQF